MQVDDSFASRDSDGKFTSFSSSDFRPAAATGTFDGADMCESTWAEIIDCEQRTIVNGNGRDMAYFPPWALTPPDTARMVAAECDTCDYVARDGIGVNVDEPDPGDICIWTKLTAYLSEGSGDNARLWVQQLTHRYGETEPILVSWWEGEGTVALTGDPHLNSATVTGVVNVVECSEIPSPQCATGVHQIAASWKAVQQRVRVNTEQFRLSTARGSIDGVPIPGLDSRWAVIGGPLPGKSGR